MRVCVPREDCSCPPNYKRHRQDVDYKPEDNSESLEQNRATLLLRYSSQQGQLCCYTDQRDCQLFPTVLLIAMHCSASLY